MVEFIVCLGRAHELGEHERWGKKGTAEGGQASGSGAQPHVVVRCVSLSLFTTLP
jgi:hypothetical protein